MGELSQESHKLDLQYIATESHAKTRQLARLNKN